MASPEEIKDRIFDACVAAFASAAVDLPSRRYTTAGDILWDNEQFTVTFVSLFRHGGSIGSPLTDPVQCDLFTAAVFEIMLLRCAPHITDQSAVLPPPAEFEAYGDRLLSDIDIVINAIYTAWSVGDFGVGPMLAFETAETIGPEGELGGFTMRVRVGIE